jgi:hypothetical protein
LRCLWRTFFWVEKQLLTGVPAFTPDSISIESRTNKIHSTICQIVEIIHRLVEHNAILNGLMTNILQTEGARNSGLNGLQTKTGAIWRIMKEERDQDRALHLQKVYINKVLSFSESTVVNLLLMLQIADTEEGACLLTLLITMVHRALVLTAIIGDVNVKEIRKEIIIFPITSAMATRQPRSTVNYQIVGRHTDILQTVC